MLERGPRRLSTGAEIEEGGVHFRVYAPRRRRVVLAGPDVPLDAEGNGFFSGFVRGLRAGDRYGYRLDDDPKVYPDPTSRFQPEGPHGPSEVVDPSFPWSDAGWTGIGARGQVIYELHLGTFTPEGTWAAAAGQLEELARVGITVLEIMPIAEFPGRFGWGYDGVDLYAPCHLYGRPEDVRAFVDRAHAVGIGVILDVVYNHLGPSGNYLPMYAEYFTRKYWNEWGDAIDFETDPAIRAYFVENAGYWIEEFHLDGLRFDATQSIHDASRVPVLREMAEVARRKAGRKRVLLVAENEPQHTRIVRTVSRGGDGLDALWNDDFHHSARAAVTGRNEAYYSNTAGTPQELISALKWGYLFQGQYYPWQENVRGTPALDLDATAFVLYVQNHDQVANSACGHRLDRLTSPGRHRALTALLLLAPGTPMLFMGQEFAASAPFHYFADHEPDLAAQIRAGRAEFLEQFPSLTDPTFRPLPPDDPSTFQRCCLDFSERERHRPIYEMHIELLRLRREDPVFSAQRADWMHGAVLGPEALLLRFATGTGQDRLVLVNLGRDLDLSLLAEPLLAPPGRPWAVLFSTEDLRFGGCGTGPAAEHGQRVLHGHSALVLAPSKESP